MSAPAPRPGRKLTAPRPQRKPRPRSHYAKCKTRTEIRDKVRKSKEWMKVPIAWLPDIGRISKGKVQMAVLLDIAAHTKPKGWGWGSKFTTDEWTPDLLDRDVAAELQLAVEAVRDEIRDLIERGVIERHPEHKHRYRLRPVVWPTIKTPLPEKVADDDEETTKVTVGKSVTAKAGGEETGNTHGAVAPPVQPPAQQSFPFLALAPSAEKALGRLVAQEPFTFHLKCRNRLQVPVTIGSTISSAGEVILDLSSPGPGSPGEPLEKLIDELAARGYDFGMDEAGRLRAILGSTSLEHFWSKLDPELNAARRKGKPYPESHVFTKAKDAADSWPAVQERQRKQAERDAKGQVERELRYAELILSSEDPLVTDEDREWARKVKGGDV